jgi:GT2 family glycosyltransferase
MGPEQTAPAVVAVVVACGHGTWLDEALYSLAAQDYPNLSVLVVEVGADAKLADRVATFVPHAHYARMPAGTTFAQAANKALEMVEGAAHVLVCHDDVSLSPDAVRLLLEEAYRSNAGLTCPKFVSWDNPDRLLSVGMGADHLGVVHPLVEPGELDQGQHDAAREVFVAPSGAVLVRSDLWRALGGFSTAASAPGEDLDLSWRAHMVGARVVVAPQARARHLEAGSKGLRRAGTSGAAPAATNNGHRAAKAGATGSRGKRTTDEQRLRVLWTCYGAAGLVLVAPLAVLFAFAESFWALLHPRSGRGVVDPLRSLIRSFSHPRALWAARRQAQRSRRVSDLAIWKAQSRGSARLRALVRPSLERGHELAWVASRGPSALDVLQAPDGATGGPLLRPEAPVLRPEDTGGVRLPEDQPDGSWDATELADNGEVVPGTGRASWRVGVATAVAVVALLLIGSRNILTGPLPLIGQLPTFNGGVASWWHEWWTGAGPGALAGSSFAPPGLLFMGLVGALSLGSVNAAVHLLVLVPLALGPLGVYVATRRFGSLRGRIAATVVYAALPIPYNALSQGHWAGLVGYAAAPWVLAALCRLGGQAPYPASGWSGVWTRFVSLGLLVAVTASLAPATFLLVPIVGLALFVGSVLTGRGRGGAKLLVASLLATAIGFMALLPWSLGAFRSFNDFFVPASGPLAALPVSSVLKLHTGPYGGSALGWAIVAAAAIPLFIGRSWRLAWAARLWVVAVAFFGLAWAGSRGWFPVPPLELVLAPAGAALAFSVALGAASVERDLPGYRFGWRQFAPAFGAVAVVAAALPFLTWVGGGQWDLPATGAETAYAFPAGSPNGDYRVLWVGSPGSLPLAAQGSSRGLAFATSLDGLPSAGELWAPVGAGRAPGVAQDLNWAESRETTALGRLFAPLAIRYVVVPVGAGAVGASENRVVAALGRQVDLFPVGTDPTYRVFANSSWAPLFSVLPAGTNLPSGHGPWAIAAGLQQVNLAGAEALPVGTSSGSSFDVRAHSSARHLYGAVQDGSWRLNLTNSGQASNAPASHAPASRPLASTSAFGWASSWELPPGANTVTLSHPGAGGQQVADLIMVVVWVSVLLVALMRLRRKLRAEWTKTSLELSTPGADVPEIDWSAIWEEQSVG